MGVMLSLPWPPSANRYYRSPNRGPLAGRHLISEEGRKYRSAVQALCAQRGLKPMVGRLHVQITASPPDRRKRDIDNLLKALLDSLTHGGAWGDDSQIDHLSITRGQVVPGGHVLVTILEGEKGYAVQDHQRAG